MFTYTEDEEGEKCIYTPKYGTIPRQCRSFDDHSLLGENFYKYKPSRILIWTNETNRISGIQTFFTNILTGDKITSGENKGLNSLNFQEFNININEYLIDCEIWTDNKSITFINLKTNYGNSFSVGNKTGNKNNISHLIEAKKIKKEKIIASFFGSYDKLMNGFGLHLVDKAEYLRILFTGYFELKYKLQKEKFKKKILEKMKNKIFNEQEETIIKTCLMPTVPFNTIMKYCII